MAYPKGPRASRNSTAKAADEEGWTCKLCETKKLNFSNVSIV